MPRHQIPRPLLEVTRFGSNPGSLKCWLYLPTILPPKAPLVVVLHGCTQNAAGFDRGSGWTQLAEEKGFVVLFPEQQRANNANLCFSWFEPRDISRDAGEAKSIREMIGHVTLLHGGDPTKVFITGLSAGGAMANVMLATYPELFAAGAIIGGLPYGITSSVGEAFERMQGRNAPSSKHLRAALTKVMPASGMLPKIAVWHGTHDQTVRPINAEQTATQWVAAHGLSEAPGTVETVHGHIRKTWLDRSGETAVELYLIKGMAHGVPLSTDAKMPLGSLGPFMLETGISSTMRIARTWNLADDFDVANAEGAAEANEGPDPVPESIEAVIAKAMQHPRLRVLNMRKDGATDASQGVSKVINDALRAAGLLR